MTITPSSGLSTVCGQTLSHMLTNDGFPMRVPLAGFIEHGVQRTSEFAVIPDGAHQ